TDEDVINAAKATGCHDFIMGLENGYNTEVGGSGGHLSGGERQRICIARAMLKDAPVVIMDEATAYTDPENEALVQESVAKLVKGRTLIVIAHRLSTIKDADKIFVINDGNIEAVGTHDELLGHSLLYKNMWKAHSMAKDEADEREDLAAGKENKYA
ncbi:MAG: ATP-binding cassette domain-containing protein, partial [Eubacterium sp.]|nr:ATP-binding cassette domain-containing protein [Eubacterium sp.]